MSLWSLQNHAPDRPEPFRRAKAGEWVMVDELGSATPFVVSGYEGIDFGPTSYVVGDPSDGGERGAFRLDVQGYFATSGDCPPLADTGHAKLTFGWPAANTSPELTLVSTEGPFELSAFTSGDEVFVRGGCFGASFGETIPALSSGWHTLILTWDRTSGVRHLYVDGSPTASDTSEFIAGGGFTVVRIGCPYAQDISTYEGDGFASVVELEVGTEMLTPAQVADEHTLAMSYLSTSTPLAEGAEAVAIGGALTWDDPVAEVTGWVLRIAPSSGDPVLQVQLPADARRFELADIPSGIAHLYAVNDHGWSSPAEVSF